MKIALLVLTSAAILASVALADPALAASGCGAVKTGHAGNTYQSCATSPAPGKLATTNIFQHDMGATGYQIGVQTNGGAVVWSRTGTVAGSSGTVSATLTCAAGSTVRAALRTKYHDSWDPTAYSASVACA